MNITTSDIISLTVNQNMEETGDSVDMTLNNEGRKYNSLLDKDAKFSKSWRLFAGYDGQTVSIFTGKHFNAIVKAMTPETITLKLVERNAYLERAVYWSDTFANLTVEDIIKTIAKKYMGYTDAEIKVEGDFSETIPLFQMNNESYLKKMRQLAQAYGGNVFNDSNGDLCLYKVYTKLSSDFTYEKAQVLNYTFNISGVQDIITDLQVIGRERSLDEMLKVDEDGDPTESVMNVQSLNVGYYGFPYIGFIRTKLRDEFLKTYKGKTYIPKIDEPHIRLLFPNTQTILTATADDATEIKPLVVSSIPNTDLPGIPTEVELKKNSPAIAETHGSIEAWETATSDYTIHVLGFNEKEIFLRITGLDFSDALFLKCIVYGNVVDDNYVMKKGIKYEDTFVSEVYDENKTVWSTHYYQAAPFVDPSTGERLSSQIGVMNKKQFNFDFISSDDMAKTAMYAISASVQLKLCRFEMTVPLNPLIERNDLIKVNLSKTVYFYVSSITHKIGNTSTTTLRGYIKNAGDKPWL